MTITPDGAIRYLLEEHLLSIQDLVDGAVRIEEVGGRNNNLRVVSSGTRSYFLKQARPGRESDAAAVAAEAHLYARVHEPDGSERLRDYLPRFVCYDRDRSLLALELVPASRMVYELAVPGAAPGIAPVGAAIGVALAACHAAFRATGQGSGELTFPSQSPPWILEVERPSPDVLQEISPAQVELLGQVQGRAEICAALEELRRTWCATALIHSDIKWSNILVQGDAAVPPVAVRVVDWEFAQWGDPAWDVGSAFHCFLADCIWPALPARDPGAAAISFATALPAAQREIHALWEKYTSETHAHGEDPRTFLDRAVRFAAARLLQTAYEWAAAASFLSRYSVGSLQLGMNMLLRPAVARRSVLGFSDSSSRA